MVGCPFRRRAMTVTPGMLGEPARRGGALAGLGQAGSLPSSPVSLGRNRVKERQPDGMIRRGRVQVDVDAADPALQQPDRGIKRPARRSRTVIPDSKEDFSQAPTCQADQRN